MYSPMGDIKMFFFEELKGPHTMVELLILERMETSTAMRWCRSHLKYTCMRLCINMCT